MNWNKVDKILNKYLSIYKRKQEILKDNIQAIFDLKIKNLQAIANNYDLSRFKRFLNQNMEYIKDNDYVYYMAQKYLKKSKINYKNILEVMILVNYAKFENDLSNSQFDTFKNITKDVYEETSKQCEEMGFKSKRKIKYWDYVLTYMLLPNEKGLTYKELNNSITIYNASQIYKQAVIDIYQGKELNVENPIYKNIFDAQQRKEINLKKEPSIDRFYGYVDDESSYLINMLKVAIFKEYGVKKCQFRAIEDSKTTKMCDSLNNQVFSINELNIYGRYSKLDDKEITYRTKGLKVGDNQPPITNNYHHCRSWLDPYKEKQ